MTLLGVTAPTRPYPGIESYSFRERSIFFGRESDARKLLQMIILYRGVMLFGDSGVGKSSLLNAALLPDAVEEGFVPAFIRLRPQPGEELAIQPIEDDAGIARHLLTVPEFVESTLSCDELLDRVRQPRLLEQGDVPVLIFDQLEELVTLFTTQEELATQRQIIDLITTLLTDDSLRVKVVFSFREEYLAKLRSWFSSIPYFDEHYLRLESFDTDVDRLRDLIRRPFEVHPGHFDVEISEPLALEIARAFSTRSQSGKVSLSDLQIVCRSLSEAGDPAADFERRGIARIIDDYYSSALGTLADEHRPVSVAVLARLVTSAGTRNIVSHTDLVDELTNDEGFSTQIVTEALDALHARARLVSRERRRGVEFYEVVSEHLIPWIRHQTADLVGADEVREAGLELMEGVRYEADALVRAAKAWRIGIGSLTGVTALVSLVLLGLAAGESSESDRSEVLGLLAAVLAVAVPVIVGGLVLARRALLRARRAEQLHASARDFLEHTRPRFRDEISDLRSEFRQRYVPLPVERDIDAAPLWAPPRPHDGGLVPATEDVRAELLAGASAERDRYRRKARFWTHATIVTIVAIVVTAASVGLAGDDDASPWIAVSVTAFYVALILGIARLTAGRRTRRRAKAAEQLVVSAQQFVDSRPAQSRSEVRALRADFRLHFVPLPVDGERHIRPSTPLTPLTPTWFQDPTGRHQVRLWDGARWTEHVADNGHQSLDPLTSDAPPTSTA